MKYLLIDANNVACRAAFVNRDLGVNFIDYSSDFNPDDSLKTDNYFPTGAMHGFFKMLAAVRRMYSDRYICIAWDGKSKSRILESREAVNKGVVPQVYKENRSSVAIPMELVNLHRQRPLIMSALSMTNIPQIVKQDEEADDIIASLVTKLKGEDIMIMTNDQDFYQLFDDNVTILNANGSVLTKQWFRNTFGINPSQWVDVGALAGDSGDNIFGICKWGEGTAIKAVMQHGTCEEVLKSIHSQFDCLREQFPDLNSEQFNDLKNLKTKDEKPKFPHIKPWMPFTGVALAYEQGKIKIPRSALMALIYEDRVPLAKKLKQMRRSIPMPNLPVDLGRDKMDEFAAFCQKYELHAVGELTEFLCSRQTSCIQT